MFKTAFNNNIIAHIWRLAHIVPTPKPNQDIDKGTSYRPIALLSDIGDTPSSLHNSKNTKHTKHTHVTWVQNTTFYSDGTTHTLAKGFNQMAFPARITTVALEMSNGFDTINIHALMRKVLQTNTTCTFIRLIANNTKRRKANTTYRNHTSIQRQFKTGVPQGGVLSPTLFNIYTADLPPPRAPVRVMAYIDEITVILYTQVQVQQINKYNHTYIQFLSAQNKIISH